jgi:drug/metabolite transporter (DMT)-like permease
LIDLKLISVQLLYYSRKMPLVNGQRYLPSTAVFLAEVLKLGISLTIALYDISSKLSPSLPATSLFSTLIASIFTGDSWKLAIPACLYTLQNSLLYLAIGHLDPAILQVVTQFKIVPIALFSVLLLRRSLSNRKWLSLVVLMLGITVVQLPTASFTSNKLVTRSLLELRSTLGYKNPSGSIERRSATYEGIEDDLMLSNPSQNSAIGLAAALTASTVGALASVYFERILKDAAAFANSSINPTSIWIRNVQLSFYSLFPALFIGVAALDGEKVSKIGFFAGYNYIVWLVVIMQAFGGIVVALCVHYSDTITKGFATTISVMASLVISWWVLGIGLKGMVSSHRLYRLSSMNPSLTFPQFLMGTTLVLGATYLYTSDDHNSNYGHLLPPQVRIHDAEKTESSSYTYTDGSQPQDFSIQVPTAPMMGSDGLSTSRPGSPALHHARIGSSRGYFGEKHRDD